LRSIEVFTVVAGIYIALTLIATIVLYAVGKVFFRVKMRAL
jgi:hypothetical protein